MSRSGSTSGKGEYQRRRSTVRHLRCMSRSGPWAEEAGGSGPGGSCWGRTTRSGRLPEAAVAAAAGAFPLQRSESRADAWTSVQTSPLEINNQQMTKQLLRINSK